jgi:hypothetical protein
MDSDLAGVIKITMLCGTFLVAFVAFLVVTRRRPQQPDTRLLDEVSSRLARMEQAVDTIAIEVERVSEGQRFTSKLLAERAAAVPPPVPLKQTTPH